MSCPRTIIEVSCDQYEIIEVGTQGPPGVDGADGPQEVYFQATAPTGVTWPAIWIKDLGGDEVELWVNDV